MRFALFIFLSGCLGVCSAQEIKLVLPVGHLSQVNTAVFSPSGKFIVTTSLDNTAKVWNAETGALLKNLIGHEDNVSVALYSPDGKYLLTAAQDNIIKIWNASTGEFIKQLKGRRIGPAGGIGINSFSFSPDGKKIVTASSDFTAKIWNIHSGELLYDLQEHNSGIETAVFSPDGKKVLTASWDSTARVWDATTGRQLLVLKGHKASVETALYYPGGEKIITASGDSTCRVWDAENGKMLFSLIGHKGPVQSVTISPDGKTIVSISDGVYVWNAATGKLLAILRDHEIAVHHASFSKDGQKLVTSGFTGAILWDYGSLKKIAALETRDYDKNVANAVISSSFSADGKKIVSCLNDGQAKVWSAVTGQELATLKGYSIDIWDAAFSPDGNQIVTTGDDEDKVCTVWDLVSCAPQVDLQAKWTSAGKVKYSPDGKLILTVGFISNAILVWEANTGKKLTELKSGEKWVTCMNFSPDGKWIAAGSNDNKVTLWNTKSLEPVYTIQGHNDDINDVSFSPDGEILMTSSSDFTTKFWYRADGDFITQLPDSDINSQSVFSPDGTYLATLSVSDTIKIWKTSPLTLLTTLPLATVSVHYLAFSPDGKNLITASDSIFFWSTGKFALERAFPLQENLEVKDIDFKNNVVLCVENRAAVKLISAITGKEITRILQVKGNEYMFLLPSGYYSASPYASKMLHYVTPEFNIISFDQMDVQYNRPDLVLTQTGKGDTLLARSYFQAYLKRLKKLGIDTTAFSRKVDIPVCTIKNLDKYTYEQNSPVLDIPVSATGKNINLGNFQLWINEIPQFGSRGLSLQASKSTTLDTVFNIRLSEGVNRIEASVSNENGLESYRMPLVVKYEPKKPFPAKVHFIGIGIDKFAEQGHELSWSVKDVKDLANTLNTLYGLNLIVDTLFNENVTTENILALKKKLLLLGIEDKVIISYSGHGLLTNNYDYYLSTYPVSFTQPERSGLPYEALEDLLDGILPRKKLMLIDACHSGEVDKEEMKKYEQVEKTFEDSGTRSSRKPVPADGKVGMKNSFELMQQLFVNVGRSTGATIISAASGTQFAQERASIKNGVFTYSILEYLSMNPNTTVNELRNYVNKRVPELTGGLQIPTSRSELKAYDWTLK
jgi:WD40 repeat protein